MHCIDRRALYGAAFVLTSLLGGCAWPPPGGPPRPAPPPAPAPAPAATPPLPAGRGGTPAQPVAPQPPTAPPPAPPPAATPRLGPPVAARNWDEFKLQAAHRLVAASPGRSYTGEVPEPLLAIPVLEVELNADGSVRRIHVMREPRQAKDTVQLAIDAVHRAAPYGAMSRLPRPWKWVEVFLFDDDRRFKPRTLDL